MVRINIQGKVYEREKVTEADIAKIAASTGLPSLGETIKVFVNGQEVPAPKDFPHSLSEGTVEIKAVPDPEYQTWLRRHFRKRIMEKFIIVYPTNQAGGTGWWDVKVEKGVIKIYLHSYGCSYNHPYFLIPASPEEAGEYREDEAIELVENRALATEEDLAEALGIPVKIIVQE